MALQARKDFGAFEKRAPGHLQPEILSDTDPADISYTNKTIVNKKMGHYFRFLTSQIYILVVQSKK